MKLACLRIRKSPAKIDKLGTVLELIQMALFGVKGVEAFRPDFRLAANGSSYFVFDIDYVSIEELMSDNIVKE